jgi:CRP-like cAMP-binding protein
MEDTLVHCIPAVDFWQMLRWPTISLELIQQLAERKRVREEMLLDMAYHSLRRRLANTLLLQHEQGEANGQAPAYIQLTREDLAALVGITSESVSRTLSEFRREQLLELTPRGIRLLQPGYLRLAEW